MNSSTSYVGLDVHKSTISVAIAEGGETATSDITVWSRTVPIFWSNWLSVWVDADNGYSFAMRRVPVGMAFIGC
jgi:hypothetical protein